MAYTEFTEQKIRHLEMLQAVIARLASQSANVKIATVLLGAVAISAVASVGSPVLGLLVLIFAVLFGLLDAYYLREERRYRRLYNEVASGTEGIKAFQMSLSENQRKSETLNSAITSWSIWPFYGGILALLVAYFTAGFS